VPPFPEPNQSSDNSYLDSRDRARIDSLNQWVQSQIVASPSAKPAVPVIPTAQQKVDAIPSSAFTGAGGDTVLPVTRPGFTNNPFFNIAPPDAKPTPGIAETLVGPGFLSGVEKEASDTLNSVPNLVAFAGAGALGTIPAIARYGGSRLLSMYFGLSMGKALWQKNAEYQQSLQDEGGLGPKSRELLGRMAVLGAFAVQSAKHAFTGDAAPAPSPDLNPAPTPDPGLAKPATGPSPGSMMSGIDPVEAANRAKEELRVNLNFVNADETTKAVIGAINRMNADRLAESRQGQSHEETISQATMSVEQALALEPGAPLRPGDMVALRDLRDSAAAHVDNLAQRTLAGDVEASQQLKSAVSFAGQLESLREQSSRTTAQTLESHKIPSDAARPALNPADLSDIANRFSSVVDTDPMTLAQSLQALPHADQRISYLAKTADSAQRGLDILHEAWMTWGLLSDPHTHAAKAMSETSMVPLALIDRFFAAQARTVQNAFGSDTPGVQQIEPYAMAMGAVDGFGNGLRAAARTLWTGKNSDTVFGEANIRKEALTIGGDTNLGKTINLLYHSPTRALMSETAFFQGVNYQMELFAQAHRIAATEGLTGNDYNARVQEVYDNPPDSVKRDADSFKLLQTFQQELGPIGQKIGDLRSTIPGGRWLQPFLQTVANIGKQGFQRTPVLSFLSQQNYQDVKAGGAKGDLAIARYTESVLAAAVIAKLYMTGNLTGAGPKDPTLAQVTKDAGRPPYSVIINGRAYGYNRFEPLGSVIGSIANFMDIHGAMPEHDTLTAVEAIALAQAQAMKSKTYTAGLSNLLDAIDNPVGKGEKLAQGFARSLVPGTVRAINREMDPTQREVHSLIESMQANTPGYSKSLPAMRNIFGEPIQNPPGFGPDILSPVYEGVATPSPVAQELIRSGAAQRLHMPARTLFGSTPPDLRLQPERVSEGVPLSPAQYSEFVREAGSALKVNGVGMKAALANLFATANYKAASDGPDGGKSAMALGIINGYRQAAEGHMLQNDPVLLNTLRQRLMQRGQALQPSAPIRIAR
jgi:hypothetical protein